MRVFSSSVLALGFRRHSSEALLVSAFAGQAKVARCESASEALARISRQCPDLIIVPDHDAREGVLLPIVERLLEVAPATPVLVVLGPYQGDTRSAKQFALMGAHLVYARTAEDLYSAAEVALAAEMKDGVAGDVVGTIRRCGAPLALRSFMETLAAHCGAGGVIRLASGLNVSRRTLSRRARQAGWPPPSELLDWIRLLYATTIPLGRPRQRDRQSPGIGLPSERGLRGISRRLCGDTIDLDSPTARAIVIGAFERRVGIAADAAAP
ncbi:MAG: hypothetical protein ABJE47_10370 [bacterium]